MSNQGVAKNSGGAGAGGSGAVMPNAQDFYSGADNWTQTVNLSPEMQALFDQQMKLSQGLAGAQDAALGRVNQMMGTGFDTSSLPGAGQALNMGSLPGMGQALDVNSLPGAGFVYDPNMATNTATQAILSRVNPELDRQQEALRNQLTNQGIAQGSAAWNNAMSSFGQQRNDAVTQAGLQGINLGMQQQGLTYNQQTQNRAMAAALQGQQFAQQNGLRTQEAGLQNQQFSQANQARQQALQEQAYLRSLPLNELNALRSGSQVQMPEFPGYSQQATTSGPDYTGAAQNTYQSQLGASNAQNASNSGMMGGLFGLAGTGLGAYFGGTGGAMLGGGLGSSLGGLFSDRRLKKDIKRVGVTANGLGIYSYSYIWGGGRMLGYMADEVERVSPHAVREVGGLKMVNYAEV
ncbi:tail fiber domain-containing protein [Achromobacter aegrifaciens]|uniref:tail fiber domain-containing protein n=1 Tax=Achromobacter aegrifaciens TaxID=1287736 RepID=UPI00320A72A4